MGFCLETLHASKQPLLKKKKKKAVTTETVTDPIAFFTLRHQRVSFKYLSKQPNKGEISFFLKKKYSLLLLLFEELSGKFHQIKLETK